MVHSIATAVLLEKMKKGNPPMGSALPLPFVSGTRILAGYRVQGTEDGKIRLLFLFSTAALEKLFFKHRPPRLAGSCFCAWELIEDGEAN